jgi:hypothetical protein
VLHDDLIAEIHGRPGSGVDDQGPFGGELQLELAAQEPGQVGLDLLGFGLRSDEPQEMIVGEAGVKQPPLVGVLWIALSGRFVHRARVSRLARAELIVPSLAGPGIHWTSTPRSFPATRHRSPSVVEEESPGPDPCRTV